jgi:hypothetical protein
MEESRLQMLQASSGRRGTIRTGRDSGGIVTGWLLRLSVVLFLIGIFAYDTMALVTARLSIEDQAAQVVNAAEICWNQTHDVELSYNAAATTAKEWNTSNTVPRRSFVVNKDGLVTLTLERPVKTLVARYIPPVTSFLTVRSTPVSTTKKAMPRLISAALSP